MALRYTPRGNAVYEPDGKVLTQYFWDEAKFTCIQGPIGCLSAETEFLTPWGWKRMDEWQDGDRVLVWSETGEAWFEHPLAYIDKPCEEMWWFHNQHSLSMVLSDEHRVGLYDRNGKFVVREAADVAAAPGRYTLPTGFFTRGAPFDEAQLRLAVAIAADGCIPKRGNQVIITVRKERKKQRLRELLFRAHIPFKEHQHSTRPTELSFAFECEDWMSKTLNLIGCGSARAEVVLDEIQHWDGLYSGDDARWDGTCSVTADFIQYCAHATGRRATITVKHDKRNPDWKPIYSVNISQKNSAKSKVGIRADGITIERIPAPGGRKYCFTTSTGFFLARHNGRVFVTGNSGTSTASILKIWRLACKQAPDRDGVRRSRWIVHGRTYSNLRETVLKTWEIWFPETEWGQRIRAEPGYHRLTDPKTGGPRDHPSNDGTKVDAEVIFLALPDEETAKAVLPSWEITGFFSNEMQNTEKGVITMLLSRCGRYPPMLNGPGPTWFGGFGDMNAPIEGHWVPYMRGDIPLPPDMTEDEKIQYQKPDNWSFYVQPPGLLEEIQNGRPVYKPNPDAENQRWLAEPYTQKIEGWPKHDIDMLVLNKIGLQQHGKPVYPTYSDDDHSTKEPLEPVEGIPILVGIDGGRDPAAVFGQNINNQWRIYSELVGENESAATFAPRVKRHLQQRYPGFEAEFWADPRYGDGTQATETTAFDVFQNFGMLLYPATSDNSPELRRSSVETVLGRRNGLVIARSCLTLRRGLSGGYHFAKIKGREGMYSPRPVKNAYSHPVEAFENMIVGGGEGFAIVTNPARMKPIPKPVIRKRPRLSRARR